MDRKPENMIDGSNAYDESVKLWDQQNQSGLARPVAGKTTYYDFAFGIPSPDPDPVVPYGPISGHAALIPVHTQ